MRPYILLCIAGMCAVTLIEKGGPLWILSGRRIHPVLERWLGFIPAAVLAALLFPEILLRRESGLAPSLFLSRENFFLIASIPALAIAYWRKSFFGAIVAGMATAAILRSII